VANAPTLPGSTEKYLLASIKGRLPAPDDKRLIEDLLRDDVVLSEDVYNYIELAIIDEIETRRLLSITSVHEENVDVVQGTVDTVEILDAYESNDESVVVDLKAVCSVEVQFHVLKMRCIYCPARNAR
jgi:hypothetical protein